MQHQSVVERAALLVLLALIPLRAIASETHRFEALRWLKNLEAPATPTPATTFGIFAVILAAAALILLARSRPGSAGCRRTGAELGAALLLLAGVVSVSMAGQKHLALIGALDFIGLILYFVLLRQLLTRPWHIRLALTVVLATGAMVVVKCAYQKFVEFPLTVEYYEQRKAELAGTAALDPDDPAQAGMLYDYEQRLKAQAVSGYFQHPNAAATYLVLIVLTAGSVAASRWRRRSSLSLAMPLLLAAAAAVTLVWTQSKGAAAACAIALLMWLAIRWIVRRDRPIARPGRLVLVFWLAALAGGIGLAGLLKARPDVLGRSMLFRSMYWQAAWRTLADQGPWGVGPDNFGRFFTRYKPVQCPEDVDDPHSWIAKAACEWGLIGLAGLILVFVGVSRRLACGGARHSHESEPRPPGSGPPACPQGADPGDLLSPTDERPGGSIILWLGGIGAIVFGWSWWQLSREDPSYQIMTLLLGVFPWVAAFPLLAFERGPQPAFADDEPPSLIVGLCAGLIGFALHAGIDLSLFWPGPATTFFAVMAIALAARDYAVIRTATVRERSIPDPAGARIPGARIPSRTHRRGNPFPRLPSRCVDSRLLAVAAAIIAAAGAVAVSTFLAKPAARLGANLNAARHQNQPSPWEVYVNSAGCQAYRAGIESYPLDGAAVAELAEELVKRISAVQHADQVLDLVNELERRDPVSSVALHLAATAYARRHQLGGDPADLENAVEAMQRAVAAYPSSPRRRMFLADLFEELSRTTGSADARKEAARQLQMVLDLDAGRIYVSKPHRLTEEQRAAITARIAALQ